eukprot:gene14940-16481_t
MVTDIETLNIEGVASISQFELVRVLGVGGFGTCYEALYCSQRVALKKLNRTTKLKAAAQSFKSETLEELYSFRHENIVQLLYASPADAEEKYILLEYIEGRNLQVVIDDPTVNIGFEECVRYGMEISSALTYIAAFCIVHLDLKPANIMLSSEGVCKLTDFGCCQYVEKNPTTPTRSYLTGTFAYRAPELLKGKSASSKADVYSLAICLWQLWSRKFPYAGMNQHAVIFRVCANNLRPKFDADIQVDSRYKDLVVSGWSANLDERPEAIDFYEKLRFMM